MKRPDELDPVELTEDEEREVSETEEKIFKTFNEQSWRREAQYRVDPSKWREERLWDEVVRRAKKAGWGAVRQGLVVTITHPTRR